MSDSPAAVDIELTTSPDAGSQSSGGGRTHNSQLQAVRVPLESTDDGSISNELCGVDAKARIRQFQHGDGVTSVCFSPDGCSIATGSYSFARVFDVGTGKEILKAIEHGSFCLLLTRRQQHRDGE